MNITPRCAKTAWNAPRPPLAPGLTTIDTDYGKKIDTDLTVVRERRRLRARAAPAMRSPESVKPCPSFEQVTVIATSAPGTRCRNLDLDKLPNPPRVHAG